MELGASFGQRVLDLGARAGARAVVPVRMARQIWAAVVWRRRGRVRRVRACILGVDLILVVCVAVGECKIPGYG
jgi:hypothetical protein